MDSQPHSTPDGAQNATLGVGARKTPAHILERLRVAYTANLEQRKEKVRKAREYRRGEGDRGDTLETIEKHYAPFVRELRDRARRIMESGEGLEITGTPRAQQTEKRDKCNE